MHKKLSFSFSSRFAVKCLNGYFIITCFHVSQKTTCHRRNSLVLDQVILVPTSYYQLHTKFCENLEKGRGNKMMKFLSIVYFHGTMNYNSNCYFLNSVILSVIVVYNILYLYIYISMSISISLSSNTGTTDFVTPGHLSIN